MPNNLSSTVLAPVDLKDQPVGDYIFLIDSPAGGRQAFAVDGYEFDSGTIRGYRRDGALTIEAVETVIVVPIASPWTIMHRDLVIFRTTEESVRQQKNNMEAEAALVKELYPVPTSIHTDGNQTPLPPIPSSTAYRGNYL